MNAAITNPINLFLLIIGTYLGIKLAIFLLNNTSTKHNANQYLGIFVFFQIFALLVGILFRFDLLKYIPHLIGAQHLVHFLFGPLVYLYVRACTQKGFQMRPILFLHFVPFALDFFFNVPFFLQSGAEKLTYYTQFVDGGVMYSPRWLNAVKSVHGIIYFIIATRLVLVYRKHLNNATSTIDATFHRWLLFFIFIVALPIFVLIGFVATEYNRTFSVLIYLAGVVAFLGALDIATLFKPALFHIFPHQMLLPNSSEEQKQKYESSNLQLGQKNNFLDKIIAYVEREKPYKSADLTLADLATSVNIPTHYVSQIINEKVGVSFIDFINGYRAKTAQELLVDAKWEHYTIMAIAYESGFNAKSTFYSVFKKQTGMTPSQYRKQLTVA